MHAETEDNVQTKEANHQQPKDILKLCKARTPARNKVHFMAFRRSQLSQVDVSRLSQNCAIIIYIGQVASFMVC